MDVFLPIQWVLVSSTISTAIQSCYLMMHRQNTANNYLHYITLYRDCKKESSYTALLDGKLNILPIVVYMIDMLIHLQANRTLILAPLTTISNWMNEFDKWIPQELVQIVGHTYNFAGKNNHSCGMKSELTRIIRCRI